MSMSGSVGEYAIPLADYPHVRANATLHDLFATLKEKYDSAEQFRSVLVLDSQDRLVGMLGLRDLLHALLPDYLRQQTARFEGKADDISALALLWQEDCAEQCRKAAALPARASITPIKATVTPADPLAKAVFLFATQGVNILPVVEAGRITGVLRIVDVLSEVARTVLAAGEAS